MTSFYISFGLTILSMASYHVAQKMLSTTEAPFSVLAVAYVVAAVLCVGAAVVFGSAGEGQFGGGPSVAEVSLRGWMDAVFSVKNWPVLLLAIAVVGIEVGVLFTYKYGASMGTLPLMTNASLLLITMPVGVLFFREHLTLTTVAGVICVLGGFWLMTRTA